MKKRLSIFVGGVVLLCLALGVTALAGPLPPASKLVDESLTMDERGTFTGRWYLQNGAFDELWDGDVPRSWKVHPGDADFYGSLDFLSLDATGGVTDNAFVFQIVNDEVKEGRNAYLYQEITLPAGDYWVDVHSTIYGPNTGVRGMGDYIYMAYYALVPRSQAIQASNLNPGLVPPEAWKELWPWSTACRENVEALGSSDRLEDCDYIKRAETVQVAGGEYVFILRAELKWPDWRAAAYYIFDDLQIIAATPEEETWNACATSYCLEGLIRQEHGRR